MVLFIWFVSRYGIEFGKVIQRANYCKDTENLVLHKLTRVFIQYKLKNTNNKAIATTKLEMWNKECMVQPTWDIKLNQIQDNRI